MKSETYEIVENIQERTDIVKPALSCLDVIRDARVAFRTPQLTMSAVNTQLPRRQNNERGLMARVAPEILTSITRVETDIITYFVRELSRSLKETKL